MGWFDKIKASVGVGGATVELFAPAVVTGEAPFAVRALVRGGKIQQRLNAVTVTLEVWPDPSERREGEPAPGPTVLAELKMPGSEGRDIAPGADLFFEAMMTAPPCQVLYDDAQRYAELVLGHLVDEDPAAWQVSDLDAPLPSVNGWESKQVMLRVTADIPGAIDPSATAQVHVIPQAAGPMSFASNLDEAAFVDRLAVLGAVRAMISTAGDRWFVWWARATGHVVAYSPLQVVSSVRPDGVHRATTNPNIPAPSVFARLPTETIEHMDGGLDEARAWARSLVREHGRGAVLLPRPMGNAFVALTQVAIA